MRSRHLLTIVLVSAASACGASPGEEGDFDKSSGQEIESTTQSLRVGPRVHRLKGTPEPSAALPSARPSAGLALPSGVTTGNGISYGGGPVMSGTVNVYYIWYGDWVGSSTVGILTDLAQGISGSEWMNMNSTYGDNTGHTAATAIRFAGSTNDNYSQGRNLTGDGIGVVVNTAITSGRLPRDTNGVYFVLSSRDVTQSDAFGAFCAGYCGWHTHQVFTGSDIKYAFVGDPTPCLSTCTHQPTNSPNGNPAADGMASVLAHELTETITDPVFNGWVNGNTENGDLCAWSFGGTSLAPNGSQMNAHLGARDYLLQQNWVNASGGYCGNRIDNTDVGVFAGAVTPSAPPCPGHERVWVHMDDEDVNTGTNRDAESGWHGISTTRDTTLQFCKVPGSSFKHLNTGKPYAVLKLGIRCPNGSREFSRYFDNEDGSNNNSRSSTLELWPNISTSNTNLRFCLFSSGSPTMTSFPEIGLGTYGVMANDLGGLQQATGMLRSDEEDTSNRSKTTCGTFCSTVGQVLGSGSDTTTMLFAAVAACNGDSANGWAGCQGTGCFVCSEKVTGYPNYFRNHPNCISNSTCNGGYGNCNANCPAPSNADR